MPSSCGLNISVGGNLQSPQSERRLCNQGKSILKSNRAIHLLDLPSELRDQIYTWALTSNYVALHSSLWWRPSNLLVTCKQIYTEAFEILYKCGHFTLKITSDLIVSKSVHETEILAREGGNTKRFLYLYPYFKLFRHIRVDIIRKQLSPILPHRSAFDLQVRLELLVEALATTKLRNPLVRWLDHNKEAISDQSIGAITRPLLRLGIQRIRLCGINPRNIDISNGLTYPDWADEMWSELWKRVQECYNTPEYNQHLDEVYSIWWMKENGRLFEFKSSVKYMELMFGFRPPRRLPMRKEWDRLWGSGVELVCLERH